VVKISSRIIALYMLSILGGLSFFVWSVVKDIKPRYREAVEESIVDTANLLAASLEQSSKDGVLDVEELSSFVDRALTRQPKAEIYGRYKRRVDLRVYVTDSSGVVLYHSFDKKAVGRDYSTWNDVYLTLQGKYGARSTRDNEAEADSSVLFSSAPIHHQGNLIGVVSVGKPVILLNQFMAHARKRVIMLGLVIAAFATVFSSSVLYWMNRPLERLLSYVREIRDGKLTRLPRLGRDEIGELGEAMEEMRRTIEGRKYVEHYVQTLTHEIKSPLSVIRGAGELLEEQELNADATRFTENILGETTRIENLVNRLLDLSGLENRDAIQEAEQLDLSELVREELHEISAAVERKGICLEQNLGTEASMLFAERFLLSLAIRNILQNALEFTPENGRIKVSIGKELDRYRLRIQDSGPGAPDWALERLCERFFSLPRNETGRKSSGLGLSIVNAVVELHEGRFFVENSDDGGFCVTIELAQ